MSYGHIHNHYGDQIQSITHHGKGELIRIGGSVIWFIKNKRSVDGKTVGELLPSEAKDAKECRLLKKGNGISGSNKFILFAANHGWLWNYEMQQ